MLSRPAETRSPKSGRTVLSESISTCCERICCASTPALRDAAAVSESSGSGAANESVRSPEVSPARVAAVSVPNVTFVRRMRSVRFLLRITMLSSVRRAAMPPASEAEASASSANDPPICSGVIPMSARSKSKTLPDTPIRCSRSVSVPETDSSRRSASSRSERRPERCWFSRSASSSIPPKSWLRYSARPIRIRTLPRVCGNNGSNPAPPAVSVKSSAPSESAGRNRFSGRLSHRTSASYICFSGSIRPFSVSWPPSAFSVEASE